MLTDTQMQQAINNLNVFIANYNLPLSCFSFENERVTRNWFFKSDATHTVALGADLILPPNMKNINSINMIYAQKSGFIETKMG
ncbi:hypothetical protein SC603_13710 [Legionella pneumophila serogroup 2]